MVVIGTAEYLSLGRSAKRKYEMAYSNSEGTFYGLKSSRLETPQELIAKTRKLHKELDIFGQENSREYSLSTAAPVGRMEGLNEPDSAEVDVEGHLQISFDDLINLNYEA
jgi:GH18 family chitinase